MSISNYGRLELLTSGLQAYFLQSLSKGRGVYRYMKYQQKHINKGSADFTGSDVQWSYYVRLLHHLVEHYALPWARRRHLLQETSGPFVQYYEELHKQQWCVGCSVAYIAISCTRREIFSSKSQTFSQQLFWFWCGLRYTSVRLPLEDFWEACINSWSAHILRHLKW